MDLAKKVGKFNTSYICQIGSSMLDIPPFRSLTSSKASQNETTFNGSKGQYIESWCQGIEMPIFGILHKILVVKMLTCLVFRS